MKLCRDVSRAEAAAGGKFGALKLICAAGIDWIEVNKILNGKFLQKCMHTKPVDGCIFKICDKLVQRILWVLEADMLLQVTLSLN